MWLSGGHLVHVPSLVLILVDNPNQMGCQWNEFSVATDYFSHAKKNRWKLYGTSTMELNLPNVLYKTTYVRLP